MLVTTVARDGYRSEECTKYSAIRLFGLIWIHGTMPVEITAARPLGKTGSVQSTQAANWSLQRDRVGDEKIRLLGNVEL